MRDATYPPLRPDQVARLLLESHADVTHTVKRHTCLNVAIGRSDAKMVRTLLGCPSACGDRAALLEMAGRDGWTPLGFAVRSGKVELAEALLEAGASPTAAVCSSGKTALEIARANRKPAMVQLLEGSGAQSSL